jgi:hypothetical protein
MDELTKSEIRGRLVAQLFFGELEKISQSIAGGPMEGAEAGEMQGGIQQQPDDAEASPAHGVVAARVEQLSDKRAVGVPVLQPPPGYVYAPELAAFVPNQGDPGWMPEPVAAGALQNKDWYDKGQQDVVQGQAQEAMDMQVSQQAQAQAQQGMMQQQASQQQAVMQQMMQQKAMEQTAKDSAKAQSESMVEGLQSPEGITGRPAEEPRPKKKSKPKKKSEDRGVTIKIGR